MEEDPPSGLIDSPSDMARVMDAMDNLPTTPPSLYLDLEGTNLSRQGSISILQIRIAPKDKTYLIDIHNLGEQAFSTPGRNGRDLRTVLEDSAIPKVFFDVRHDSDALHAHFHVKLAGVQDLQLVELATRAFSRRYVKGLSKCIENDLSLSYVESRAFQAVKELGLDLFAPERGGSYEVFKTRPMSDVIVKYCMQDVRYLPRLWSRYDLLMSSAWRVRVEAETKERIRKSQSVHYNGKGKHMALGPW